MNSSILTPPKLMRQNAFHKTMEQFNFFILENRKKHRRSLSLNQLNYLTYRPNFTINNNNNNNNVEYLKIRRINTY